MFFASFNLVGDIKGGLPYNVLRHHPDRAARDPFPCARAVSARTLRKEESSGGGLATPARHPPGRGACRRAGAGVRARVQ